jgi:hypothetical protein
VFGGFGTDVEVTLEPVKPERRATEFEKEDRVCFTNNSPGDAVGYGALRSMLDSMGMSKAEIGAMIEAVRQAMVRQGGARRVREWIGREGAGMFWIQVHTGRPRKGWKDR